jgi:flagellar hook-length control protein FliK
MTNPVQFQDIMEQIEESAAKMLKKGPGRIVITLEPPNLGTLNVDVKVHNDMVRLVLIADNHEVKQVLQTNLDQLKTALQDQGLNMDRFDVLVQQRSSENPGFHQWGGALFGEGRGRRENTNEDTTPPPPLPVHSEDVDEPHLGIISLFA